MLIKANNQSSSTAGWYKPPVEGDRHWLQQQSEWHKITDTEQVNPTHANALHPTS